MSAAPLRLLDVVALASDPQRRPWGAITQVRRYGDGSLRYAVAPFAADEIGTVLDAADLGPTGERADAKRFTSLSGFRRGAIVRVRRSSADAEIAGKTGEVVAGTPDGELVGVQIDGIVWSLPTSEVEDTGERAPRERTHPGLSLRVGPDGKRRGTDEFELVEDLSDLDER